MFKRSLILGSLVAGAFLLPSLANAGVVTGLCVQCHTMHDSQNGVAVNTGTNAGQHASLLKGTGCIGCHADAATNIATTGKGTGGGGTGAPQVDETTNVNAGGYFTTGGMGTQHNVAGLGTLDTVITGAAGNIPGSATLYTTAISCSSCHTQAGHHAAAGGATYRMLTGSNNTTSPANTYNANPAFPGDRSAITYNAADMNTFCGSCHANFHGASNYLVGGEFVRHPTGNTIVAGASIPAGLTFTDDDIVVGTGDVVMCLSCHVAHGGPNADLLSFAYTGSANYAGDGGAGTNGCEKCHSYSGTGM